MTEKIIYISDEGRNLGFLHTFLYTDLRQYEFDLGRLFPLIDKKYYTYDEYLTMAKTAISQLGINLQYISKELITEDLCKLAARSSCSLIMIPKEFRTLDVCIEAVKVSHDNIRYCEGYTFKIIKLLKDISLILKSIIDVYGIYKFPKDIE